MFPLKDNIPLARFPLVTVALFAINLIAYLLEIRHGGSFFGGPSESVTVRYGAIPYELTHPGSHCGLIPLPTAEGLGSTIVCVGQRGVVGSPPAQPATLATVFTSMFLHGSFLHIFGNMLFLAIFGPTVEDAMGRARYLAFYLLGGIVALGAQVLVSPDSTAPTLGASGAIAAVLGGYVLLYPRARVLTLVFLIFFVTIVEVPALMPARLLVRGAAPPRRVWPGQPDRQRRSRLLRAYRRLRLRRAGDSALRQARQTRVAAAAGVLIGMATSTTLPP